MTQIDGTRLQKQRKAKRLTQEALAEASGIDLQTISRIERGQIQTPRARTIEALAKALKVDPNQLASQSTDVDNEPSFGWGVASSQFNRRVDHDKRNAFSLVAQRYGVSSQQILDMAPLIFAVLAEQSLNERRIALSRACIAIADAETAFGCLTHLTPRFEHYASEALAEEDRAIERRDLFARTIPDDEICYGFATETHAPFVRFLAKCVDQTPGVKEFGWYNEAESPHYLLEPGTALELAGGDEGIAEAIVAGQIGLHEMDRALLANERLAERLDWMLAQQKAHSERVSAAIDNVMGSDWLSSLGSDV